MEGRHTTAPPRDDRILPFVRLVAFLVVPFLLVAFAILFVRSELAADLFAWPIRPRLTAMILGSAYLGGAVFFCAILGARRWHEVGIGLPPILLFVVTLIATTAIHWNLFSFDRIAGPTWVAVYLTAAPLVVGGFVLNRRRDPGPEAGQALLPLGIARMCAVVGLAVIGLATLLFLVPQAVAGLWPWRITALSGRVLAASIVEPGALAVRFAIDRRWSALRAPLVAQMIALVAILAATFARGADLVGPVISVVVWWVGLFVALIATVLLLVASARPRRPVAAED